MTVLITPSGAEITNWVCSAAAIVVLLIRAYISRNTIHVTKLSKWICAASILTLAARIPIVYHILRYNSSQDDTTGLRTIHAILVLLARALLTIYLWMQAALLLRFYTRIIGHDRIVCFAIHVTWAFFFTTLILNLLVTFLECHPVSLVWSDHYHVCQEARIQIFTQAISCVALDTMLLGIVVPVVLKTKLAFGQKLLVTTLVSLGAFCIIVTGLRLVYVHESYSQTMRSFWAAINVVVTTLVVNTPTIVGCINLKRRKRLGRSKSLEHVIVSDSCEQIVRTDVWSVEIEMNEDGARERVEESSVDHIERLGHLADEVERISNKKSSI